MTEEFLLCSCSSMRDYHTYRHTYTPAYTLYRKDDVYSFDVEQLPISIK